MNKISEEKETVSQMISIYCRKLHGFVNTLCTQCGELRDYAFQRLDNCVYGENKGSCGKCSIHCYKPFYREMIREVMRFSGPRMIIYNPKMAIKHLMQSIKKS